ncbi:MAG: hypothetical protein GY751_17125 [Bacteroidetes bacterium]|nr:hypothetical protein [Bacteroidota bacterium]
MRDAIIMIAVVMLSLTAISCDNDGGPDMVQICDSSLDDLGNAATSWATSPANHTEINCNAFKASLLQVLNNCDTQEYRDLYGGQQGWEDFVDEIEMLDCSMFP